MNVSINWLKDFVEIPKDIKELAQRLVLSTVEVEKIIDQKNSFNNIVVGQIKEVKPHPNADKLQLALVDIGKETLEIVCGAPNIKAGQKVPVALIGAELPNGLKIEPVKIRGVESSGMLCAEDELGLGKDHAGILIMPEDSKVGSNLAEAMGLNDTILDIDNKSLTHRPDLWGHYGIAREVSAIFNKKLNDYPLKPIQTNDKDKLKVSVKEKKLCPRYIGVVISDIKIEPSPEWLINRLKAAGVRPINNIVDITNYVLFELGQPLHAFDYNKLASAEIIVRQAKKGEKITTLDEEERVLSADDLVIADKEKAIAIAGVMGGANSEVDDMTEKIVLESANFNQESIRKTQQSLGIRTEASMRFEKSLDPNMAEQGIKRAINLIQELIPEAKISSPLVDESDFKLDQGPIQTTFETINKKIGKDLSNKEITDILNRLGFQTEINDNQLRVTVPTWRATLDVHIPEDLVEEVARIYGYNNLEPTFPKLELKKPWQDPERLFERRVKLMLAQNFGLTEVYNYSFISQKQIEMLNEKPDVYVKLKNPLNQEIPYLRKNLIPYLVKNLEDNYRRYQEVKVFEIGQVFLKTEKGLNVSDRGKEALPAQPNYLGILYYQKNNYQPFFAVKNILKDLFKNQNFGFKFVKPMGVPNWLEPDEAMEILVNNDSIGFFGHLNSEIVNDMDLKGTVAIVQFNFTKLSAMARIDQTFKPLAKYPSVELDISMIIDQAVEWLNIKNTVVEADELIKDVSVFDVFASDKFGKNKKSIAFHVTYQSDEKTLTLEEVEKIHDQIKDKLISKFKSEIR